MDFLEDEENFDIELAMELLRSEIEAISEDQAIYQEAAKELELLDAQEKLALNMLDSACPEEMEKAQNIIKNAAGIE